MGLEKKMENLILRWEASMASKREAMVQAANAGDFIKAERLKIQISELETCRDEIRGILEEAIQGGNG